MTTPGQSRRLPALPAGTIALVATLIAIYMVSQFLRNSVGVIAPNLAREIGLSAAQIGVLSSAFFFAFAAVQIPLGVALDRFGPRACLLFCVGIAVVGAVTFALARTPGELIAGRVLLGLGSSASFMAPLALYARRFPAGRFATLVGLQLGIGSFGTLFATAPLAFATALAGWRNSFLGVGLFTLLLLILVAVVVREDDGAKPASQRESWRQGIAGILAVLRTPSVGPLFLMHLTAYSSFALIVGLWGAPYLTHIYGYGLEARGNLLLLPALTQILGSLTWGPLDRRFGSYKRPVLVGAGGTAALLALIAASGTLATTALIAWLAVFGFICAYTPVLIAHGRSLFPPHLVGRGITLLNVGSMGGVFVAQLVSGFVIDFFPQGPDGAYALNAYRVVFALQAVAILLSCLTYLRTRDPRREFV
jgi:MFS family permease